MYLREDWRGLICTVRWAPECAACRTPRRVALWWFLLPLLPAHAPCPLGRLTGSAPAPAARGRRPAEEVARICEWLTEKLDSFSSKLKPEAKELAEVGGNGGRGRAGRWAGGQVAGQCGQLGGQLGRQLGGQRWPAMRLG